MDIDVELKQPVGFGNQEFGSGFYQINETYFGYSQQLAAELKYFF
jgi:hypothetical protein